MEHQEQKNRRKISRAGLIAAIVAIAVLLIGLTYAWFFQQVDMATMLAIAEPSDIAIRGPHGKELTALDLSYSANEVADGKVTIQRVISVSTDADAFQLEIVHTTNLKGLTFTLYPAMEVTENANVTDGGYQYAYSKNSQVSGEYINSKSTDGDYKYANNGMHAKNYGDYSNVQTHAEPLYWLANKNQTSEAKGADNSEVGTKYLNYYVLEISWTETTKETDIFYVLAQNVQ